MPNPKLRTELAEMVAETFELMKTASAARARARTGHPEEISEIEFLALDVLLNSGSLTVGEIQKRIGVLPAQMSRIIRSLESKDGQTFVSCSINPDDRRKIDVKITAKGQKAHEAYRATRLAFVTAMLNDLSVEDREMFMRVVRRVKSGLMSRMSEIEASANAT